MMSLFQQPGKDVLVGSSSTARYCPSLCSGVSAVLVYHGMTPSQRTGAALLEEKWQCRSSRREGSNAVEDGMYKCLFLAPKYLLLL